MSTRCFIAIARHNGYEAIYSHSDGYPEYLGAKLAEHYSDPDPSKREALLALGNISVLRAEIGEKHPFRDDDPAHATWTLAYGRDRGERNQESELFPTFGEMTECANESAAEFLYLWLDELWLYTPIMMDDPTHMDMLRPLPAAKKLATA